MILKTLTKVIKAQVICIVLLTLVMPFFAVHAAYAVNLKQNVVVYDNVIKAADIFTGLGDDQKGARVLGVAPQPGQEMTINAHSLLRVAMAMDIDWRPVSSAEYVTVQRASNTISRKNIADSIKNYAETQDNGHYKITLDQNVGDINLPHDAAADIRVASFTSDPQSRRFKAGLQVSEKNTRYDISGSINRLLEVPVLKSSLRKGDIIAQNDVEYTEIVDTSIRGDVILNADDLVGKTPRQSITAGSVIKANDLDVPLAVKRGDLVTMIFERGSLQLSAMGKALQNGAIGDAVRVVNTESNRTIEGIVSRNGQVKITTF